MDDTWNSQKEPHISPSWVSYGVSGVSDLEKIDHIITALHCTRCRCPVMPLGQGSPQLWVWGSSVVQVAVWKFCKHDSDILPVPIHLEFFIHMTSGHHLVCGSDNMWMEVMWPEYGRNPRWLLEQNSHHQHILSTNTLPTLVFIMKTLIVTGTCVPGFSHQSHWRGLPKQPTQMVLLVRHRVTCLLYGCAVHRSFVNLCIMSH